MNKGLRENINHLVDALRRDESEPLVLMRSIWRKISKDVVSLGSGKLIVPYSRVTVAVLVHDDAQKNVLMAVLEKDRALEKFVREKLTEENCKGANRFHLDMNFVYTRPDSWGTELFAVVPDNVHAVNETKSAILTIVKGKAEKKKYRIEKRRTYIGRLREVKDADGRTVRRNDVVFEDTGDKVNTSVGRLHACIESDDERKGFLLEGTGGCTGTRLERDGEFRDIQISQRVRLRDGDIIHLGRAAIRFAN